MNSTHQKVLTAGLAIVMSCHSALEAAEKKNGAAEKPTTPVLMEDGLMLYYNFNTDKGTDTVSDSSGMKQDGTIDGGYEYVKMGKGFAIRLDGKRSFIERELSKDIDLESAGALACWFNGEAHATGFLGGGLINWSTGSGHNDQRLVLGISGKSLIIAAMADGQAHTIPNFGEGKAGEWTHIALTWDGKSIHLYRDGKDVGGGGQAGLKPVVAGVPLWVGKAQGIGEPFFKGMIDEVRVYNRALFAGEILEYYEATKKDYADHALNH
ncbi:MAG: LamG domain-containing protein [Verrucomicrobia bacterium]|nr:LamG domain-containing protein [Verrucomicrobiota bacterium]